VIRPCLFNNMAPSESRSKLLADLEQLLVFDSTGVTVGVGGDWLDMMVYAASAYRRAKKQALQELVVRLALGALDARPCSIIVAALTVDVLHLVLEPFSTLHFWLPAHDQAMELPEELGLPAPLVPGSGALAGDC